MDVWTAEMVEKWKVRDGGLGRQIPKPRWAGSSVAGARALDSVSAFYCGGCHR